MSITKKVVSLLLAFVFTANLHIKAFAEEVQTSSESPYSEPASIWQREKLTGDWWGLRSDLANRGITFDIISSHYYQDIVDGGVRESDDYGGKMDYIMNVDWSKNGLWDGLLMNVHAETQFGNSIVGDAGAFSFPNTSMLFPKPDYSGTAVTGLYFQQAFNENFAVLGGKLNVLDVWTMVYPHTGAGLDGFMNTNMLAAALPWLRWVNLSVMGGGALALTDDGQIDSGILVHGTKDVATTSGFSDMFKDGVAAFGLKRFFFDVDGCKPASFLIAAGMSTRDYASLDRTDWTALPAEGLSFDRKEETWSAAAYYDQVLWQCRGNEKQNLRLLTGWSLSDGNPSFAEWGGFASVEGWGLLPNRPADRMGIGGFYNEISSELKDLTEVAGFELEDIYGIEAYYNMAVTPSMHLTGDIQVIDSLNKGDDAAVILGLRAVIDF